MHGRAPGEWGTGKGRRSVPRHTTSNVHRATQMAMQSQSTAGKGFNRSVDASHDVNDLPARSLELQHLLWLRGFRKGLYVNAAGIAFLDRLARRHGVRTWANTRDARDYDELYALLEVSPR